MKSKLPTALLFLTIATFACNGSDADSLGVAAECVANDQCDEDNDQVCLMEFKGGYCGIKDCTADVDCPENSACVDHDDGTNYCFRTCIDKAECNENRSADQEANCSANVTFVEAQDSGLKACVPPSA